MAKRLSVYERYVRDVNKLKAISEKRGGQLYGEIFSEKQFKSQYIAVKNMLQDRYPNYKVKDSDIINELVQSHSWMSQKEANAQLRALREQGILGVSQEDLISGKNVVEFTDKMGRDRRMDIRVKAKIDLLSIEYEETHGGTAGLALYISQQVFGSR